MSINDDLKNYGNSIGSVYLGLLDAGLKPPEATDIAVRVFGDMAKRSPQQVMEEAIKKIERDSDPKADK